MNNYNLLINARLFTLLFYVLHGKMGPTRKTCTQIQLGCTKITATETSEEEHKGRKDTRKWDNVTLTFYRPASCKKTPLEIHFICSGKKEIYGIISILFFTTCHLMHNLIFYCI